MLRSIMATKVAIPGRMDGDGSSVPNPPHPVQRLRMADTDLLPLLLGLAVLFGRVGFCLYLTGSSRSKNAAGTALRTVADLCIAVLAFWAIGNAIFTGSASAP